MTRQWPRPERGMFADPLFWRALRREIVPMLRTWPLIRVWVAGCGSGEEAWSMAVLLEEEGLGARARVQATDRDEAALERARRGTVAPARLTEWATDHHLSGGHDLVSHFEVEAGVARLRPELLGGIGWARHLPEVDGVFNEFSLIVFRHPFVWTGGLRHRVVALLRASQARFGFLCVDDATTLRWLDGWEPVDPALGIARRVA